MTIIIIIIIIIIIMNLVTTSLLGLHRAIAVGVKQVAVFGAASETFSQKNINCTVDESLQRFELVRTDRYNHQSHSSKLSLSYNLSL